MNLTEDEKERLREMLGAADVLEQQLGAKVKFGVVTIGESLTAGDDLIRKALRVAAGMEE